MVEGDERLEVAREQRVHERVVEVEARGVRRPETIRHHPGPGDREAVGVDAEPRQQLEVGTKPWGGGAIMNLTSNPGLNNVTFSGNNSVNGSGTAGGDAMRNASNSNPVIRNSILWADLNEEIVTDAGSTVTLVDSVVQGGCPALGNCTNLKTTTPNLGALANNGGFTQTMAISAGSSALNAGGVNFACAPTDQRGISRPQGSACDIGAFELDSAGVPVTINQAAGQADSTNSSPINPTACSCAAIFQRMPPWVIRSRSQSEARLR